MITDAIGNVVARRDFLPFGEEVSVGVGGRTGSDGQKYSSNQDDIRQKFTGYQKDEETQLDFAEARMYENRHARFTAVDPLLASGKSANPQSFNRYVYVFNNPIVLTDPTGLQVGMENTDCPHPCSDAAGTISRNRKVINQSSRLAIITVSMSDTGGVEPSESDIEAQLTGDQLAIRRLSGGHNQNFEETQSGAGKGIGNVGIDTVNGGLGLAFSNFSGCRVCPAPQIQRYNYDTLREAQVGTAFEFTAFVAPTVVGKVGFASNVSRLSVVPRATNTSAGILTNVAGTPQSILKPGGNIIGTPGSKANIRELPGGMEGANSLTGRLLSTGTQQVAKPNYPGNWFNFNSGGGFGIRTKMTRSPNSVCTIDINCSGVFKGKLKF